MKRSFCLLLALLILLMSVPCVSMAMTEEEGYQYIHDMFANSTDEELKNLLAALQYELAYRENQSAVPSQKEVTVPAGSYTIGSDIPAGTYTIAAAPSAIVSMITVYSSSGGLDTVHTVTGDAHVGKIEFKDGQRIEIVGSSVIFKPYAGLGF